MCAPRGREPRAGAKRTAATVARVQPPRPTLLPETSGRRGGSRRWAVEAGGRGAAGGAAGGCPAPSLPRRRAAGRRDGAGEPEPYPEAAAGGRRGRAGPPCGCPPAVRGGGSRWARGGGRGAAAVTGQRPSLPHGAGGSPGAPPDGGHSPRECGRERGRRWCLQSLGAAGARERPRSARGRLSQDTGRDREDRCGQRTACPPQPPGTGASVSPGETTRTGRRGRGTVTGARGWPEGAARS